MHGFVQDASNPLAALLGGFLGLLDADDAIAGVQRSHRDAGAHQAGTDDADSFDLAWRDVFQAFNLAGGALCEEDVAQCRRLFAVAEFDERAALFGQPFRQGCRRRRGERDGQLRRAPR